MIIIIVIVFLEYFNREGYKEDEETARRGMNEGEGEEKEKEWKKVE